MSQKSQKEKLEKAKTNTTVAVEEPENTKDFDSSVQHFSAGFSLVLENEISRKMFIIKKGKARVYKTYMGRKVTLAILGQGEIVGELSFFDAQPRSASVEALTELSAIVIDGEKASEQIAGLPKWIFPIFRSVFQRFRDADQKMTVLQSMNEYQKKTFKHDTVAQTIYMELLRFVKTLTVLYDQQRQSDGIVKSDPLIDELDDILGNRYIGLRVFWRMLKEYDFVDHEKEEREKIVELKKDQLDAWIQYLDAEVESERYLLLSHSALAVLRRIVGIPIKDREPNEIVSIPIKNLQLEHLPLSEEGVEELITKRIIQTTETEFKVVPEDIHRIYPYQSILKAFDHSSISLE